MDAKEYEAQLTLLLYSLPEDEREEAISFYLEQIADRIDDGATEEEAVASVASPAEAAKVILANRAEVQSEEDIDSEGNDLEGFEAAPYASEFPDNTQCDPEMHGPSETQDQNVPPQSFWQRLKRGNLSPLEWVGVICSSVIWLPLLIALASVAIGLAAVVFSLYLCTWIVIACVWITGFALVLAAPLNIVTIIVGLKIGNVPYMMVNAGYSLFAFGLGVWILKGAAELSRLFLRWQKTIIFSRSKRRQTAPGSAAVPQAQPNTDSPEQADTSRTFATSFANRGSGISVFLKVCLALIVLGLIAVAAGFALSGFDWHVFMTSFVENGDIYIGGTKVESPFIRRIFGFPY